MARTVIARQADFSMGLVFATLFMIASVLYDKESAEHVGSALYLIPTFIMIGYLVRYERPPPGVIPFLFHFGVVEKLGLARLIFTARLGIYLSRARPIEA